MVKSYQGVRKEEEKDYTPALVKDYMTKQLITFSPKQTVNEVVDVLVYRNISGGPVINEDGQLIGIISEGDCLKEIMRGHYNNDLTMSTLKKSMVNTLCTIFKIRQHLRYLILLIGMILMVTTTISQKKFIFIKTSGTN